MAFNFYFMKRNAILGIWALLCAFSFSACSSSKNMGDSEISAEMENLAKTSCSCMQPVLDMKKQKPKNEADSAAMLQWKSETTYAMTSASECMAQRMDTLMKVADINLQKKYGDVNSDAYREAMGKAHEAFIVGLKKHCPDMYNVFPTDDTNMPK